ncbi:MAG TPA: beta-N-acetylhexosaminidase [Acidobacteriaceae bacterium]|nr:beta-N-acetylhexosaminidase [Acidobacteriaceae bacterium]
MKLREQVGQLIIVGVEGVELSAMERAWLRLIRPSGVILFRRNIEQAQQVVALLREATQIAGAPLFRCVDLEGGLVDRLRDLIAPMPSAAAVFATGKKANFARHGRLIAREAKALGFNTTFAPVLDLALPASAAVMKSRVVSANPADVIAYAGAFVDGLDAEGVLGCGKHFPGLGGGTLDSHEATPRIERTWQQLWAEDLVPFRALVPRLPLMMVSHAAYPQTRDSAPASVSRFWISTVLKKRIGYQGLVISDDMEMGGILTQMPIEDAAVKAVLAGTDLIEICRDPSLVIRAYEALLAEAERSAAFRRRVESSCQRVIETKNRLLNAAMPRPVSAAQINKLREALKKFSGDVQ